MPRALPWSALALVAWSRARPSGVVAPEDGSSECEADAPEDAVLARFADCLFTDADCLSHLNASSGADLVRTGDVMAAFEKVGRDGLHAGSIKAPEWVERFASHRCVGAVEVLPFPESATAADSLRTRLRELSATGPQPLLVHVDGINDGLGARFKKAIEVVAAALQMGFFAVALALPPAGSAVHLAEWEHGAVWCHESPAGAPGDPGGQLYPLICWRFELQADLLGQSPRPEGRVLLWGAPGGRAPPGPAGAGGSPLRCFQFKAKGGQLPEGLVWNFVAREGVSKAARQRLFESARAFSAPLRQLAGRREARCGFGGPDDLLHAAVHVRRGDVGDSSMYAVTQQMSLEEENIASTYTFGWCPCLLLLLQQQGLLRALAVRPAGARPPAGGARVHRGTGPVPRGPPAEQPVRLRLPAGSR
ncbi:unnamed protein product [Prorocentrum cordatum]|uniref:Uncharacterized protein n=1 Tax=Prorocentrum cordatum TaxID=2364126 RepID=A0ABN9PAD7_9DINO|nr:unnamed protein product [Polarella glacialis]